MTDDQSGIEHAAELDSLRARLAEAEDALRAIRSGNVDAVLVSGERGEHVYTLNGADRAYRRLVETMSEGAATLSADGIILYCNDGLARMVERPLDLVIGSALRNYLPPEDQRALDAVLAGALVEPGRVELNLRTSDGRLVSVYLSAFRLRGEDEGAVFGLVLTDLTEQRRCEQVNAAERLARLILEQVAEAVVVCDEHGRVVRASQAAERMCDGSPLRRTFAEAFPLRSTTADPFHLALALQGETLRNVDVTLDRPGQTVSLVLSAGPLLSGREILGCVITLTDITAHKLAEEALRESLREQGALLSEVHHRVKNNLQVITSLLRLEAGRSRQPETKDVLVGMQGRIMAMALLHETLYRSGTLAAVDLGTYLAQLATQSFRAMVTQPGSVQLHLDMASIHVDMDQAAPCGLLMNELISNSLKHGFPAGRSGDVGVDLHMVEGASQVRLRVTDTGVGLPVDFAARRGKSLGLQLVCDLAKQLRGTLDVGHGPAPVFTLTFPLAEPKAPDRAVSPAMRP